MKSLHVGAVVLLAAAVQAHAALPSNGIVPSYGYSEVTVPGQASVSGLAVAGTLEKRGLGTLTLTNLLSVPGTVLVQQGTVTLAETAPSVLPASLQSGLAFWVDANTNYVLNGSGTVEKWLDVREAATNEPYAYMRAEHDFTYYPDGPRSRRPSRVQGVSDVNGNAMIDFGAFGAIDATAAWLPWRNADGTRGVLSNIRAVFAVAAFPDGNGFFVEDWDYVADSPGLTNFYGSGDFWLGAETQFKRYFYLFGSYAEAYKGATYVNGVRVNGGDRVPDALGQVIEVMAANTLTAANFFNGRNIDGYEGTFPHIGGGRLGEVLVYTNVLTEAERLGIESYLQRKWKGLGQVGVQRVEAGATLVTEAQAGSTLKLGGVEGAGLWRKTGEGSAGLSSDTALFNGAIRLEAGALEDKGIVRRPNRLFDVPEQGLVVQADTDRWAVVASALGALTKTGAGELTVTGFPTSVSQVNVNGGTLRLTQALRDPEQVQPVTIYNNSFEIFTDHNFHGQWASAAPDLWGFEPAGSGWTYTGNPTESSSPSAAGIYMPNGHTAIWCATQPASDGEWVAIIKQGGGMATTFNVSTAGRYRLVFYAAGRNNCGPHLLDILIDGQLISKTRTTHPQFIRYAYKLPDLTAGTHTLAFQGIDENSDRTSLLDDIRIERIGDSRVEATVPNGTFERMDPLTESDPASPVVATGNDPGTYSFTYAVANGDWTFVPFGSGISDGFSPWLSQQITGEGARSAYIRMQGTLSTTVVFPTNGTYTLSFLTAARPPWKGWMYSPHDFRVKMSGLIVLTRNNVNTSFERVEVTLPTITNAPTAAELVFEGINSMGDDRASLFDDVQVVRSDDNQVHDCGFEVPTGTLPRATTRGARALRVLLGRSTWARSILTGT